MTLQDTSFDQAILAGIGIDWEDSSRPSDQRIREIKGSGAAQFRVLPSTPGAMILLQRPLSARR